MDTSFLIIGLGNPGNKYENNRHNIGFMVIDRLACDLNITISTKKTFKGWFGDSFYNQDKLYLIKPNTYMNNSGESVRRIADFYKIHVSNCIVIYDDADLNIGKLRIKTGGGHGGHNGIRSMINHLGSKDFIRIKVGIKTIERERRELSDFVLSNFSANELNSLDDVIKGANDSIKHIIENGALSAMNKFNGLDFSK